MVFQGIEFEPTSASPSCILFPVHKMDDRMYATVDAAMGDRWYELGGIAGIEQGFNLEQITDIKAYLMPQVSRSNPRIGYKLDISTSGGIVITRKARLKEPPQAVAELLDNIFAMGVPGLDNDIRVALYQQHRAYRQRYGTSKADKIIELLENGFTVDQVLTYMQQ